MTIDIEKLREDLIDYLGSGMTSGMPMAVIDLGDVEKASPYKLVEIAKRLGVNLKNYAVEEDLER